MEPRAGLLTRAGTVTLDIFACATRPRRLVKGSGAVTGGLRARSGQRWKPEPEPEPAPLTLQDDWGSSESYTGERGRDRHPLMVRRRRNPGGSTRRGEGLLTNWGEDRQSVFMVHWSAADPSTNVDRYYAPV